MDRTVPPVTPVSTPRRKELVSIVSLRGKEHRLLVLLSGGCSSLVLVLFRPSSISLVVSGGGGVNNLEGNILSCYEANGITFWILDNL